MKTASSQVHLSRHGSGLWQTDRRTNRQTDDAGRS